MDNLLTISTAYKRLLASLNQLNPKEVIRIDQLANTSCLNEVGRMRYSEKGPDIYYPFFCKAFFF